MDIPESYIILDLRTPQDFKNITISGFKKNDVVTIYQNSMINNKLEDSLKWCVELHSSGFIKNIWDSLYLVYIKYIHILNPHFYFYFHKKYKMFYKILDKYPPKKHEIFSRNDQEIRHIFAELTSILTLTKKNNLFLPKSLPKIDKHFYTKENIQQRMISKNLDQLFDFVPIQQDNDVKLAMNEILWNLAYANGTYQNCFYWILWLDKVEMMKRKDKIMPIVFDKNDLKPVEGVDDEYWSFWCWSLWDIILFISKEKNDKKRFFIEKMYEDFKTDFKPIQINRKKLLFFISFYILKNSIDWNLSMYHQEHFIIQACANINTMYREIKQHLEKELTFEDKNFMVDEYSSIYLKFLDLQQEQNEIYKPSKHPELLQNTCISKIDPTHYPHMKPLSRKNFKEEPMTIEYHHMIEEQARNIEKEIEKEIYQGHRSRMSPDKLSNKVVSRVERIRKQEYMENADEPTDGKVGRKLELYSQFITYKSNDEKKKEKEKDEENHPKWKTIEFQQRQRSKRNHIDKYQTNDDNYDDEDY
jgi:hypothetical protein